MPFYMQIDGDEVEVRTVDLRQCVPKKALYPKVRFKVLGAFYYRPDPTAQDTNVPAGTCTDLASVPSSMWSVISSYGHQTMASIVHDVLCERAQNLADRKAADDLFLVALKESEVAPLRRRIMWSTVRLFGVWKYRKMVGGALFAFSLTPMPVLLYGLLPGRRVSVPLLVGSSVGLGLISVMARVGVSGLTVAVTWPPIGLSAIVNSVVQLMLWVQGGGQRGIGPAGLPFETVGECCGES